METHFLRGYIDETPQRAEAGTPLRFIASTSEPGRDNLIIRQDGWQLDRYRANPVFLWAHRYDQPPIGRTLSVDVQGDRLIAEILFDQNDEFARTVEAKYRSGFLNAVSVGWRSLEMETPTSRDQPGVVTKAELLDISAVPVPGDPHALIERQRAAYAQLGQELLNIAQVTGSADDVEQRGAIPPHTTEKAPEDTMWDGPAEVAKAPNDRRILRMMHAWVDDNADPDTKRAYKLPHHLVSGEVVWRGVAAAMARLMQAGTDIPEADRRGVYEHLARHYRQFDREPPEFRSLRDLAILDPAEIRGLFFEDEPDLVSEEFAWIDQRAGAVLSARNRDRIEQAIALLHEVLDSAQPASSDSAEDAGRFLSELLSHWRLP